jgi:PIN domain nuclease of toxin-antitoxin system
MILLDTQAVVWLALEPERLSAAADAAVAAASKEGGIAIADKTLWELAMMWSKKKMELDRPLGEFLLSVQQHCVVLPITAAIAERSVQFGKSFPGDPADQIIAATALVHGLALVTADKGIRKSGEVPCIW